MKALKLTLILFVLLQILSACGPQKPAYAEYLSATGTARVGKESRIELEDGAAIVVPAHSLHFT